MEELPWWPSNPQCRTSDGHWKLLVLALKRFSPTYTCVRAALLNSWWQPGAREQLWLGVGSWQPVWYLLYFIPLLPQQCLMQMSCLQEAALGCRAATEQLPHEALLSQGGWGKPAELFFLGTLLREKVLSIHPASFNGQSNNTPVKKLLGSQWGEHSWLQWVASHTCVTLLTSMESIQIYSCVGGTELVYLYFFPGCTLPQPLKSVQQILWLRWTAAWCWWCPVVSGDASFPMETDCTSSIPQLVPQIIKKI